MADPEQIYQEVLSEEQAKGSASVVAEARAKAARQRATEGSPHPKEPKWWPGAQPQFEGGDGAAPAAEAEPEQTEEAPAEEAPAEEAAPAPAAEEQAPAAAAAPAEPVATPPELTRDQPEAPTPAAQPAAATAPVAPAATATAPAPEAAAPLRPTGVTHGTPAGNRLRPEDAVATEPQFEAQAALHQRRKMIDELVSTGVPAVSARSSEGRGGGVGMLLLYLLIPLIAVGFLVSNQSELAGGGEQTGGGGGGGEGGGLSISAANVQFDKDELTIPADGASLTFINDDTVEHNVAIYEDEKAQTDIFVGDIIPGGQETTYDIPAHEPGEYYFQCDVHPAMNGTATFE